MREPLIVAADRLADVLVRENDALRAMDLLRVTALLPEKTAAIARLTAAGAPGIGTSHPGLVTAAQRLDGLALENRRLLKRAIVAQQRVIGIVVRAATSAAMQPAYGTKGRRVRSTGPLALSTRA